MRLLIAIALFSVLCKGVDSFCFTDQDCPSYHLCDLANSTCIAEKSCTADDQCGTLELCDSSINGCTPVPCMDNSSCTATNTICSNFVCACADGFMEVNGNCAPVLNSVCFTWSDCSGASNAVCRDRTCQCNSYMYKESNGVCVNVHGTSCSDDNDCGTGYSVSCQGGTCLCDYGYKFQNGYCRQVLYSYCDDDNDCPLDNAECDGYRCSCVSGATRPSYSYNRCEMVLGSSCSIVDCYYNRWTGVSTENHYCDQDNVCRCLPGYKEDNVMHQCVSEYGTDCSASKSCGDTVRYRCEYDICLCAETFFYDGMICETEIGASCDFVNCNTSNVECDSNNMCSCIEGYKEQNGQCVSVMGAFCTRDNDCAYVDNAMCGRNRRCRCREGFVNEDNVCEPILGRVCYGDIDCVGLENTICNEMCACSDGTSRVGNRCLRQECVDPVPPLPNIASRSLSYTPSQNEPLNNDGSLDEGWYSMGIHRPAFAADTPSPGSCGTFYPIFLTEALSDTQLSEMRTSEINIAVSVGGYYDLTTRLRMCGEETHVYIPPLDTKSAAFCLDHLTVSTSTNTYYSNQYISSRLNFYTETINGTDYNMPHVSFECTGSSSSYQTQYQYYTTWYVNGDKFAEYGPFDSSSPVSDSYLNETELVAAGYTLGFTLQCSNVIINPHTGLVGSQTFSDVFHTDVYTYDNHIPIAGESYVHRNSWLTVPLGCITPVGDVTTECSLKFDLIDDDEGSICQMELNKDKHAMCGVTIRGVTKYHFDTTGSSVHSTYSNNNGVREYFGTHIRTFENEEHNIGNKLKAHFAPHTSEVVHPIWDNYIFPDINIVVGDSLSMSYGYCAIYSGYIDTYTSDSYGHVNLDEHGVFTFYRSKLYPVEIQINLEQCEQSDSVCLCGVTVRNGDDILTKYNCGGVTLRGVLHGQSNDYNDNMMMGGLSFQLLDGWWFYSYNSYGSEITVSLWPDISSPSTFVDSEGLCSFTTDEFRYRDGFLSTVSDGFLNSWSVPPEEALHDPTKYTHYGWQETYFMCGCPTSQENVTNRVVVDSSSSRETHHVYTGILHCTLENQCTTTHPGLEWPSSLLPAYTIVNLTTEPVINMQGNVPQLKFRCNFNKLPGYLYNVTWLLGEVEVHSVEASGDSDESNWELRHNHIASKSVETFILDVELKCGVTVLTSEGVPLTVLQYSSPFKAVEIVTPDINIIRGGDAVIVLNLNIPFFCNTGEDCWMYFSLYDPTDSYDCQDSTIAVKSQNTCGKKKQGARYSQEVTYTTESISISITTKNDNTYTPRNRFSLILRVETVGSGTQMINGEFKQRLNVVVRDEGYWMRHRCYANNDPRILTFDGLYYTVNSAGEFVMYSSMKYPAEIHMVTQICNGGWAACSCGVTVRALGDIFSIVHCSGQHITGFIKRESNILTVRRRTVNRYQIYLPHGTMVDVYVSPWRWYMVNINIYPSPSDVGSVRGLCGNFNGDYTDDLTHEDGTVDQLFYYWIYIPGDFIRSWEIDEHWETKSHLSPDFDLWGNWTSYGQGQLCVCPGNHSFEDAICDYQEDYTCTTPVSRPGVVVETQGRNKRSVDENETIKRRLRHLRTLSLSTNRIKRSTTQVLNETEAISRCNASLHTHCQLFLLTTPEVDMEGLVSDCARDLSVNPEIEWFRETCDLYETVVERELQMDVVFQELNENITEMIQNITRCPGNCSGNGICIGEDTCSCFHGFRTDNCFLDISIGPVTQSTYENEMCDLGSGSSCNCLYITSDGHLPESLCNFSEFQATVNGSFEEIGSYTTNAEYINLNELLCCRGQSAGRRRRSADSTFAEQVGVSISNDGVTFGNTVYVYILDSTCQEIVNTSGTPMAVLQTGYCFIDGGCHQNGSISPGDTCFLCDTDANLFEWVSVCNESDSQGSGKSDEIDTSTFIMIGFVSGLALLLVVIIAGALGVLYYKKKQRAVQPGPSGTPVTSLYDDIPKQMAHNVRFKNRW